LIGYIVRRLIYMVVLLIMLSFVSFLIIQLPPGDYLTTYLQQLEARRIVVTEDMRQQLVDRYGLGDPFIVQYFNWAKGLLKGDFGESFLMDRSVASVVGTRLALSVVISLSTLFLVYLIAIPIGIYSATHQNSIGDYIVTILGFLGLATPNFLLALILMFLAFQFFGWSPGGLFSREYIAADWSWGKVVDLMKHLPVPLVVIGTAGTAEIIRILRGSLLDELNKQYVITARSKGLEEGRLLIRYPVRVALNPIMSTVGYLLPAIVSGAALTAIVLSLPTIGPLLLQALKAQDMYLAGAIIMLLSSLGLVGTLISDMLLVILDPRIRFEVQG
jgi:peptide/nickel transport system permease protein